MARSSIPARIGLVLFGVLFAVGSLLALEVFLRLFGAGPEPAQAPEVILKDPRLGWRNNPAYPGIDARGWRNGSALDRADIVVLGDSVAYGYNVSPESAWPQRLGRLLHLRTYQMAVPGFGPDQYFLLFDEARALKPRAIIADYYLGNDLFDAYFLAYRAGDYRGVLANPVLESFKSTDPKAREAIRRAEAIDPGLRRYDYMGCGPTDRRAVPDPHLQQVHDILTAPPLAPIVKGSILRPSLRSRLGSFLRHSATYRMVRRALGRSQLEPILNAGLAYGPPICVPFQDRQLRTVFAPAVRAIALDRTDPRVVEGERIALSAYRALADRCRRAGIRFYVVVTPTKETAFRARAEASVGREPYLRDVWDEEALARSHALAFFKDAGITVIDPLPALARAVASGVNPYGEDSDGHPVESGYQAIARTVADTLQHDGFTDSR